MTVTLQFTETTMWRYLTQKWEWKEIKVLEIEYYQNRAIAENKNVRYHKVNKGTFTLEQAFSLELSERLLKLL